MDPEAHPPLKRRTVLLPTLALGAFLLSGITRIRRRVSPTVAELLLEREMKVEKPKAG
jgi:hypothetical protein